MPPDKDLQASLISKQLKRIMEVVELSGHAILPGSNDELLRSIVETAARIFNAAAASILLVNEEEQVLVFKVAHGTSNRELVGLKFPMDKGIAGYVVMTGQPLAISNVRQDARFNQDFARSTGYVPNSILAMPMLSEDRVIGVMEVLDKISASSFGIQDMELLALFAHQAAIAIDQSQQMEQVKEIFLSGLKKLALAEPDTTYADLFAALDTSVNTKTNADLIVLADLFNQICEQGEAERKACMEVLRIFADYRRSMRKVRHDR